MSACVLPFCSLINNEDKTYFKKMLVELATKHGVGSSCTYDEVFGPGRYIMFGDWIKVRPPPAAVLAAHGTGSWRQCWPA